MIFNCPKYFSASSKPPREVPKKRPLVFRETSAKRRCWQIRSSGASVGDTTQAALHPTTCPGNETSRAKEGMGRNVEAEPPVTQAAEEENIVAGTVFTESQCCETFSEADGPSQSVTGHLIIGTHATFNTEFLPVPPLVMFSSRCRTKYLKKVKTKLFFFARIAHRAASAAYLAQFLRIRRTPRKHHLHQRVLGARVGANVLWSPSRQSVRT